MIACSASGFANPDNPSASSVLLLIYFSPLKTDSDKNIKIMALKSCSSFIKSSNVCCSFPLLSKPSSRYVNRRTASQFLWNANFNDQMARNYHHFKGRLALWLSLLDPGRITIDCRLYILLLYRKNISDSLLQIGNGVVMTCSVRVISSKCF
jgi:hypothetical protein